MDYRFVIGLIVMIFLGHFDLHSQCEIEVSKNYQIWVKEMIYKRMEDKLELALASVKTDPVRNLETLVLSLMISFKDYSIEYHPLFFYIEFSTGETRLIKAQITELLLSSPNYEYPRKYRGIFVPDGKTELLLRTIPINKIIIVSDKYQPLEITIIEERQDFIVDLLRCITTSKRRLNRPNLTGYKFRKKYKL